MFYILHGENELERSEQVADFKRKVGDVSVRDLNVTVIDGLPQNAEFLAELAGALKKSCGTGGTVRTGAVELNGDVRERIRPLLAARGFTVKG